jgi:cytochrome c nitrite reductase small subunit
MRPAPALAAAMIGIAGGLGVVTFDYAEGLSYMSEDPRACVNCHIMRPQYDGWVKASHHGFATCNDCHLPQTFLDKYVAKARNGWGHSKAFTTQDFPEPIRLTPANVRILQDNCITCHDGVLHDLSLVGDAPLCTTCHSTVGHGQTAGLGGPMPLDPSTELP